MKKASFIFGNWKMQLSPDESVELAKAVAGMKAGDRVQVGVIPSFLALPGVASELKGTQISLGAQDCFWEMRGAYTGEVSPDELRRLGCSYVLVGHSERRQYMGETNEMVNKKIKKALVAGITPILCVGETEVERANGTWTVTVEKQLRSALMDVSIAGTESIIVAYEPVWAIGTGKACSPDDARHAHAFIKSVLVEIFGTPRVERSFKIIYGGSVDAKNIVSYLEHEEINGALVGGASQKAASFAAVLDAVGTLA